MNIQSINSYTQLNTVKNQVSFKDFDGELYSDFLKTPYQRTMEEFDRSFYIKLQKVEKTIVDPSNQIVLIANSNRKEKAKQFEEMIRNEINPKEIISVDVGLFCAPNIGPGLCAAYYLGEEKSEDLSKETAIFNEILGK